MTSQRLLPSTDIVAPSVAHFYRIQNFHGRIPIDRGMLKTCSVVCNTEYPQRKDFLETGLREFICAVLKQTWASALQKKIRLSLFENGESSVSVLTSYY